MLSKISSELIIHITIQKGYSNKKFAFVRTSNKFSPRSMVEQPKVGVAKNNIMVIACFDYLFIIVRTCWTANEGDSTLKMGSRVTNQEIIK